MSLGYRLRGALPASLLVCAACALAPGAAAAGTLDQQQAASSGSGHFIDSTHGVAQSFTAGISGGLDQVDLMLQKFGGPSAYLSVEIRDLAGGTPGGLILAGRSVPASSIPTSQGLVSVHFAPAAPVLAGTPYAIVAYSAAAASSYLWFVSPADSYAGGNPFFSTSPPSTTWTSTTADDQAFSTYVVPSVSTPAAPTGRRAAALKKCKRSHSKKKRKKCRKRANLLPV